jgi:precorrin-6x reductase
MYDVILFGGTTEGRELAGFLSEKKIPALVSVATRYGEQLLDCGQTVNTYSGRMNREDMYALFRSEEPKLVIDATHPYAAEVRVNILDSCRKSGTRLVRVLRETSVTDGCRCFSDMSALVEWLNETEGVIFSAMGAKEAAALTAVSGFRKRVILRILPSEGSIAECIGLGYPVKHLLCMQGPFSEEFNRSTFLETGASILVTKESGRHGGFAEKINAAKSLGMEIAVLSRPPESSGMTVEETKAVIEEVCL